MSYQYERTRDVEVDSVELSDLRWLIVEQETVTSPVLAVEDVETIVCTT